MGKVMICMERAFAQSILADAEDKGDHPKRGH